MGWTFKKKNNIAIIKNVPEARKDILPTLLLGVSNSKHSTPKTHIKAPLFKKSRDVNFNLINFDTWKSDRTQYVLFVMV